MRGPLSGLLLAGVLSSCAAMDESVRVERGPKLREFERPRIVEGGVTGKISIDAATPSKLTLALSGYDTCRTERVEEFAEERIRERRGAGAGASISAGVLFTAASVGALVASFVLSKEPDRSHIDGAGRYGPSQSVNARAWSIGFVCIGVPALAVGLVQWLRTGEQVETVKVEQLAGQRDEICNVRPIDGPLHLRLEDGSVLGPMPTASGVLSVEATPLKAPLDGFVFYEREVTLDEGSRALLIAFNGCAKLEREAAADASAMATGALLKRLEAARACRQLRGDAVQAEQTRLEEELARRREGGEAGTFLPGAKSLKSFEEAVQAYPPRFTLVEGSADLAKGLDELTGQNVLVRGRVQAGLSPNIGVVAYADREVFVFLPPDAPWVSEDFPLGSTVELVGVVSGLQTVGERTAPLVRAVWMRKVP